MELYKQTYVCMCANGVIEYGFTYKVHPDDDDCVRDEPVGRTCDADEVRAWCESQGD